MKLRQLKKLRVRLHDDRSYMHSRFREASAREQWSLAQWLRARLMQLEGALAENAELIRQARIAEGKPWRGKGC